MFRSAITFIAQLKFAVFCKSIEARCSNLPEKKKYCVVTENNCRQTTRGLP
jgi:hypothetical protein